ncbi:MAG: hypothetical protein K9G49_15950 [Taibaiella sp.]|nr:hypothetical protein [Taibaiella sp.]
MNISFTEKQEHYISAQLKSGDYQNGSLAMEELRSDILIGWDSPLSKRKVTDIIGAKTKAVKS